MTTMQQEIDSYSPKESPLPTEEIKRVRILWETHKIDIKQISEFWQIFENKEWLEEKWAGELYNRDSYLRLLELREENKDDLILSREIGKKISLFAKAINECENPFPALRVNVKKELVSDRENEGWDE